MISQSEWLLQLAGDPEYYLTSKEVVNRLVDAVLDSLGIHEPRRSARRVGAARLVRDLLAEMTKIEIEGLITVGDEHEYACWALLAGEMSGWTETKP